MILLGEAMRDVRPRAGGGLRARHPLRRRAALAGLAGWPPGRVGLPGPLGEVRAARVGDRGVGQHVDERRPAGGEARARAPARSSSGRSTSSPWQPSACDDLVVAGARAAGRRRPSSRRGTPSGASRAPRCRCCPSRRRRSRRGGRACRTPSPRSRRRRRRAAARPGARGGRASPPARSPGPCPGSRTGPGSSQQPGS